jgi:alpha-tubulin suppressor-like RCC1 family protein
MFKSKHKLKRELENMSWRKGYSGEYKVKKTLIEIYGAENVLKIAIGGAMDFIVFKNGECYKSVEVKTCHSETYNPSKKEKLQFKRIVQFCKNNKIKAELKIYYPNKQTIETYDLFNFLQGSDLDLQ